MKKAIPIAAVAAAAAILAFVYLNYSFMFWPIETQMCAGDAGCISEADAKKDGCVPSSTIIAGRDGIMLMVNITREGSRCIRTESIVDPGNDSSLADHNNTCEFELSQLGNSSATACPGSIYDFIKPAGGGGGGGNPPAPPAVWRDPFPNCGVYDYPCKERISSNVQNCVPYEMTDVDMKWEPNGYWTGLISVYKINDSCIFYLEVLNAVNLPPDVPSDIIGKYMTCTIPLSELPITYIPNSSCIGNLYTNLYQLAT